jgi:hypothetical protein
MTTEKHFMEMLNGATPVIISGLMEHLDLPGETQDKEYSKTSKSFQDT